MKRKYQESDETLEPPAIDKKKLIVFNDNFNTFGHVIEILIQVCKHNPNQAEQCTWIIHHKGQCVVKEGSIHNLQPMCTLICNAGITSKIV